MAGNAFSGFSIGPILLGLLRCWTHVMRGGSLDEAAQGLSPPGSSASESAGESPDEAALE